MTDKPVVWKPQAGPQEEAVRAAFVDEIFYGGAAGGGKSDYLLGDYAQDLSQGKDWQGVLFRKTYPELDELVHRSHEIFPQLGGEFKSGKYNWVFSNGAVLKFRHMENELDFFRYIGHQYSWIGMDELPNWPNLKHYHMMKSRLRGPAKFKRMRSTGNPGGPGHLACKEYFGIHEYPKGRTLIEGKGGSKRMFIPSRITDNKILLDSDPNYIERLREVGDEQLVKAWLDGDWDALVGQYFISWRNDQVVIPSFEIPDAWPLFGAMDYGESAPTSFGLYTQDYDKKNYRIAGYYQAGLSASQHAANIAAMIASNPFTGGRKPSTIVADPSMFVTRRHMKTANASHPVQVTVTDIFRDHGLYLRRANNDRITGWRLCNDTLQKNQFHCFDGWNDDFVRTVPSLPRSRANPEDVDTTAEDHAGDEWRYMQMHLYGPAKRSGRKVQEGTGQFLLDQASMGPSRTGRYGSKREKVAA